jgi:hypothetical protein
MPADIPQNDRILPWTRIIAAAIVPFLLLAFLILYVSPQPTGRWFAWDINPRMTAAYMGAGYLGGAYFFLHTIFGTRWHRTAGGFFPVTAFTVAMLIVTIIHWGRFELTHLPFLAWLLLYIFTPVLLPWTWLRNRPADSGSPEVEDAIVPNLARWALLVLGVCLLLFAVVTIISPSFAMQIWPWTLSELTARVLGGWSALLAVGGILISREDRWSAWRVGLESIALWHVLVLIAAVLNRLEFKDGNLVNWYLISVVLVLTGMVILYLVMQSRSRGNNT